MGYGGVYTINAVSDGSSSSGSSGAQFGKGKGRSYRTHHRQILGQPTGAAIPSPYSPMSLDPSQYGTPMDHPAPPMYSEAGGDHRGLITQAGELEDVDAENESGTLALQLCAEGRMDELRALALRTMQKQQQTPPSLPQIEDRPPPRAISGPPAPPIPRVLRSTTAPIVIEPPTPEKPSQALIQVAEAPMHKMSKTITCEVTGMERRIVQAMGNFEHFAGQTIHQVGQLHQAVDILNEGIENVKQFCAHSGQHAQTVNEQLPAMVHFSNSLARELMGWQRHFGEALAEYSGYASNLGTQVQNQEISVRRLESN